MLNRAFFIVFLIAYRVIQPVWAQEVLTNQSVLNLHQNKVSSSIIIDKIKASQCNFDLSTTGLIQLLGAKVNDSVIESMMIGTNMTDVITNIDIIRLREANMARKLLARKISGSRTKFDLTTTGLIQLKNGNVPDAIQKLMMAAPVSQNTDNSTSQPTPMVDKTNSSSQTAHNQNGMKGVQCRSWIDKFTKKKVTVSRVILRGRKAGNILLGASASTLVGVEDMEVSLLFRRDNNENVLVLYAIKPGLNNLQVERTKTLMFLMDDSSVMEFKPIMDAEYGADFDYTGYNLNSKLCVYYSITESQLRTLTKKLIKNYRLNTYNRHTTDDTVNRSRAEQIQVSARCLLDEVPVVRE